MSLTLKQQCESRLTVGSQHYQIYSLSLLADLLGNLDKLPKSLKVLAENLLRNLDGDSVQNADLQALIDWQKSGSADHEIAFRPARVLMQDFTRVPAVVDLAAMRQAIRALGGKEEKVNPLSPVDLVIDHSVMVDEYGSDQAFAGNVDIEMSRNNERYRFLRWGQQAFDRFRVVPPGTGICHQVNLEYLGKSVWYETRDGKTYAYRTHWWVQIPIPL